MPSTRPMRNLFALGRSCVTVARRAAMTEVGYLMPSAPRSAMTLSPRAEAVKSAGGAAAPRFDRGDPQRVGTRLNEGHIFRAEAELLDRRADRDLLDAADARYGGALAFPIGGGTDAAARDQAVRHQPVNRREDHDVRA